MQVPVGTLPSGMKLGFLEMESLTSHNQFLLGLGINSDNHNSLLDTLINARFDKILHVDVSIKMLDL